MKKQSIIPILIIENKYPYNCTFYQEGNKTIETKSEVKRIIEKHLKQETEVDEVEVAFLGKSFTSMDKEKQKELLETVNEYIEQGKVNNIRISAKPNEINKTVLKELKKYNVKTIELEAISCNDYILKYNQMEYKFKDIKKASKTIRWKGFNLGFQMMIGLPGSTRIDETNTVKSIVKLKPKVARITPIYIIKGTELEKEYNEERYQPLTEMQGVEICKELVRLLANKDVETIRIGFQDAEIKEGEGIIAGPYHPAFRQWVEVAMWNDAIVEKIKQLNAKVKEVEVTVNPMDVENVIGINNENILKLKEMYDVDLIVKSDEEIKQGKSKIEIVKTYNDFLEE